MNSPHVIITGGEGDLAKALKLGLEKASLSVATPSKSELNVIDSSQVKRFFEACDEAQLLICNAGLTNDSPLARMGESEWDEVIKVNLRGAFLCAREASRMMVKRRGGHIILVSSFSALQPPAGQANYATAKAALLGFMKALAKELGPRNVRVNAVLPGFLETKMTDGLSSKVKQRSLEKHVLGRFNTPEAVADFVTFLHQKMPNTSGQVFNLDSRVLP